MYPIYECLECGHVILTTDPHVRYWVDAHCSVCGSTRFGCGHTQDDECEFPEYLEGYRDYPAPTEVR